MLSEKMTNALNTQIELEGYASFLYLAMASWFDQKGMEGCAKFMYRQSNEEHMHMMKLFNYVLEMDAPSVVPGLPKPPSEYDSPKDLFEHVYQHEQKVTKAINNLVDLSIQQNDHSTHNFLQWYVEEQREEESLMRSILDKLNLIGDGPQSLYFIDKELDAINTIQEKADAAEEG